jgi:hypothetical protein
MQEIFKLENPIKVHFKEDGKNIEKEIDELYLSEPSAYEDRAITINLRQPFLKAMVDLASKHSNKEQQAQEKKDDDLFDEKSIKLILTLGFDGDELNKYYDHFKEIASRRIFKDSAKEQKINKVDLNKLSETDFDNLLTRYLHLFFVNSWMKTLA